MVLRQDVESEKCSHRSATTLTRKSEGGAVPDRWEEVEELFSRGLELDEAARQALLASAVPEVAQAVQALWRNHQQAGAFLQDPVVSLE